MTMTRKFLAGAMMAAAMALSTPAGAAEKLTVLLEWFVNPDHAPLVVAKQLGLFEKAGLDVELVPPSDPSAVPRLVAAGQVDIGIHYQPALYFDHQAGIPIRRFGTLVETPLNTVSVLKGGPVKSLADLKGKKIGYSVSGFETAVLGRMLEQSGVSIKDIELINVNFALSASLISGQVDATIGGYRNFEMTQLRLEGHEGTAFYPEENGVPVYDELIYISRPELAQDQRLQHFLDAVEQGTIYLTNHPEESWKLFIAAYPDLDNELNAQAWKDTLPRFAKRPAAMDAARYNRFAEFLKQQELITEVPAISDINMDIR